MKLCIEPNGGLGNRIQSMVSAYKISKEIGAELSIIWKKRLDCNAYFDDLFETSDENIVVHNISDFYPSKKTISFYDFRRVIANRKGREFVENIRSNADICVDQAGFSGVADDLSCYKYLYISSMGALVNIDQEDFNWLKINIHEENEELFDSLKVLGVHIRKLDSQKQIDEKIFNDLLHQINSRLKDSEYKRLYVSSNCDYSVKKINEVYPNIVIWQKTRKNRRDTTEGIKSAIVDMYFLSKCSFIQGTYASSFGQCAGKFGGVEYSYIQQYPGYEF